MRNPPARAAPVATADAAATRAAAVALAAATDSAAAALAAAADAAAALFRRLRALGLPSFRR